MATTLSKRVSERMEALGWTKSDGSPNPKDLERGAKIGYATAYSILHDDDYQPTTVTLQKVASALRVPRPWLMGDDEDFDVRAYQQGKEEVAKAVRDAIDDVMGGGPTGPEDPPGPSGPVGATLPPPMPREGGAHEEGSDGSDEENDVA